MYILVHNKSNAWCHFGQMNIKFWCFQGSRLRICSFVSIKFIFQSLLRFCAPFSRNFSNWWKWKNSVLFKFSEYFLSFLWNNWKVEYLMMVLKFKTKKFVKVIWISICKKKSNLNISHNFAKCKESEWNCNNVAKRYC